MALCLGHKFRAVDASGNPLAAGKVYTYSPGTTNNKDTYSDRALTTPNANPVVLDAAGEADIYLSGPTKLVVKTSADVTIDTVDSVDGIIAAYDSPTFTAVTTTGDITVGDDLTVTDDAAVGGNTNVTGDITATNIIITGFYKTPYFLQFEPLADASAWTNIVYVRTSDGKLCFRDSTGTVTALY